MVNLKATVRVKTKNGLYPVYIRFTKKTQVSYIKTAWVVNEKGLGSKKEVIDPYVIQQTSSLIETYYRQLNLVDSSSWSVSEIVKYITDYNNELSFSDYARKHIEKLNEEQLVTFRRDHVGFIFQSFHLMGTLNAVENVALPLSFRGVPRDVRVRKANEMLDLVKLGKHKKHLPNQMSGGQQQRVGVARALVVDPDIIFADEPTGNLDSHTSEEVMELMQRVVREQKKTLVMVTHDDHLATYADRVFHIRDGRIIKIEDNGWKKGKEEGGRHAETNTERDRK